MKLVRFSITLTPSRGEKEQCAEALGNSKELGILQVLGLILPLPWGEGWGEGEGNVRATCCSSA